MANGFMPNVLLHQKQIMAGTSLPSVKLTPPGFLRMLLQNTRPNIVSMTKNPESGHYRDIVIAYRKRSKTGQSSTTDDCSIDAIPTRFEYTLPTLLFRKKSIFLEDETIAKYEEDASKMVANGATGIPSTFMNEQMDALYDQMNGLIGDINLDVATAQASAFGVNAVTGLSTARAVNFPQDGTLNDFGTGMTLVNSDIRRNEMRKANVTVVGNGVIADYYEQVPAIGPNQSGLNVAQINRPAFFEDEYTASAWGANQFGIFEKDAVQWVEFNKFKGQFKTGEKGGAWYGTWPVLLTDSQGNTFTFVFDVMMEYVKCKTTGVDVGGSPTTIDRGWVLHIMKYYNIFGLPATAYLSGDRLFGNNGSLRYVGSNT